MAREAMHEKLAIEAWMSPQERLARQRINDGPVKKALRPCDVLFTMTPEQQAQVDAMTDVHARTTLYRAMKDAYMQTLPAQG